MKHWNLFILGDASETDIRGGYCLADEDFFNPTDAKEWAAQNFSIPIEGWEKDAKDYKFEDAKRDIFASLTLHDDGVSPHAAAESWDGRPEFGNDY